ncbi:MAG: prepilin-type N-terminal cleavage/methylation domain-containing protein [Phycisphaerales bacterium]|nr:prepilin-type N-terminal cleavage/methylation domain-containing protein [Phycisphaerales bacterium]
MRPIPLHRRRRGFGLVEALLSLTISAMLLTAISAAFAASAGAIRTNDRFFQATQTARVGLHHLLSEIRTGAVDEAWDAHEITLITGGATPEERIYRYLPDKDQLVMILSADPTAHQYILARDVTDLSFSVDMGTDYNNAPCVARVNVSLSVHVGDNDIRLSGAAAPRRNLIYK